MRPWLGRKLMRLALRLLGWQATRTICFSHETWDAESVARWAVAVVNTTPNTPVDVMVLMSWESRQAFDHALAIWDITQGKPCGWDAVLAPILTPAAIEAPPPGAAG